jgi:hypothetical protein
MVGHITNDGRINVNDLPRTNAEDVLVMLHALLQSMDYKSRDLIASKARSKKKSFWRAWFLLGDCICYLHPGFGARVRLEQNGFS